MKKINSIPATTSTTCYCTNHICNTNTNDNLNDPLQIKSYFPKEICKLLFLMATSENFALYSWTICEQKMRSFIKQITHFELFAMLSLGAVLNSKATPTHIPVHLASWPKQIAQIKASMKSANKHNWEKINCHMQTQVTDTEAEDFCRVRPQHKVGCQAHGEPAVLQDLKLRLTSGNGFMPSLCQGDTASCPHCPDSWDITAAHQSVSEPP